MIYPVHSGIQPLNNRGQGFKVYTREKKRFLAFSTELAKLGYVSFSYNAKKFSVYKNCKNVENIGVFFVY